MQTRTIGIAGGGLAGLAASLALRERGYDTQVFEATPSFSELGVAVVLAPNGVKALDAMGRGIGAAVRETGHILPPDWSLPWHSPEGEVLTMMEYGDLEARFDAPQVTIRRADLHRIMLEAHTEDGLNANAQLEGFADDGDKVMMRFADGATREVDVLIGADGIRSAVRRQLHGEQPTRYSGSYSVRGITYGTDLPHELSHGIWVMHPETVLMCSTIGPQELYWSAIVRTESGTWPRDPVQARAWLLERIEGWDQLPALIADADPASLNARELRDRPPLTSWGQGLTTLVGDAAHVMTNFWGQGANTALEDGVVLAGALLEHDGDLASGLRAYEAERIPRTTRIVNSSAATERDAEGRPWNEFIEFLYGYRPDRVSVS